MNTIQTYKNKNENIRSFNAPFFSKLEPTLSEDEMHDLVKTSLSSVLSCLPDDEEHNLLLMEKTLMALSDLLKELLIKDMTVKTFNVLLQVTVGHFQFSFSQSSGWPQTWKTWNTLGFLLNMENSGNSQGIVCNLREKL